MNSEFYNDVIEGLKSDPKRLSSKYFYNEKGDELFQAIMALPEYYLTNSEFEILQTHKESLLNAFREGTPQFELIELGAGDGLKTKILLEHFVLNNAAFRYRPVDISENVLQILKRDLIKEIPELNFEGLSGDYFKVLEDVSNDSDEVRNVVLFLGSNIGNYKISDALNFLKRIHSSLNKGDLLLIGFDLKKDPKTILSAYNDSSGVTRDFNLNLLRRINEELDADFDLDSFSHYPTYDPLSGETKSYLISNKNQTVTVSDQKIDFLKSEPIFMEISQKYGFEDIECMAAAAGFEISANFLDSREYFVDSLWTVI